MSFVNAAAVTKPVPPGRPMEACEPVSAPVLPYRKRAALWLVILLACLFVPPALVEGVLRWVDYGESTSFVLRKEMDGKAYHVPNRAFYQQFTALPLDRIMTWDTLDFQVPKKKGDRTRRIFVFGGSAIYGTRASARILEVMLEARHPDIYWEVYNAACPGMNSHVMRAAAQACSALEPDVFLVYMGNNEAVGPFGPTTALGQTDFLWRPAVIHFLISMNRLRITQLLRANTAMVALNLPDTDALMGMMPSMTEHHRALLYYADNLQDICDAAKAGGAELVLCTLSSNKRFMGKVSREEPDFNGLSINGIVREQADRYPGARLADVEAALAEHSEDGLPGYEFFHDNVHFNFAGNYLAARSMLDAVLSSLHLPAVSSQEPAVLSRGECAQRLAWTDAAEFELLGWQLQAFQDEHTRTHTRERYEMLQQRLGDTWRNQLVQDHLAALEYRPDDLYLRHACFQLFLEAGRYEDAEVQCAELGASHPAARVALRARGVLAARRGEQEEAVQRFRECLAVYPDDPPALKNLGELLYAKGDALGAKACYQKFLKANPDDVFAWCRTAELQKMLGDAEAARDTYEMIITTTPKHPLAHRLLDDLMRETDTTDTRAAYWDTVMKTYPEAAEPKVRRALLYLEAGEGDTGLDLLRDAAALAPDDPAVQYQFGETAYARGAYEEAEQALRKAVRLQPADGRNRLVLIQTLLARGDIIAAQQEIAACEAMGLSLPADLRQRAAVPAAEPETLP